MIYSLHTSHCHVALLSLIQKCKDIPGSMDGIATTKPDRLDVIWNNLKSSLLYKNLETKFWVVWVIKFFKAASNFSSFYPYNRSVPTKIYFILTNQYYVMCHKKVCWTNDKRASFVSWAITDVEDTFVTSETRNRWRDVRQLSSEAESSISTSCLSCDIWRQVLCLLNDSLSIWLFSL